MAEPLTHITVVPSSIGAGHAPTPSEPRGYPKLATFMGKYQDVAIFRQFKMLNMLNLLSLQAELIDLEDEYQKTCGEDDADAMDIMARTYTSIFASLRDSEGTNNHVQLDLLKDIREKLHIYNAALLQAAQLSKLEAPDKYDLQRLREWLNFEQGNFLQGHERGTWNEKFDYDQAILAAKQNGLSRSTATSFMKLYDRIWGRYSKRTEIADPTRKQRYYPDSNLEFVAKVFTSVLASLVPGIVILVLNYIETTIARIGAMLAFTGLFAFVLSYWTTAETIDIFAATAAFAAVEVVFIGSAIPSNSTSS